MESMKATGMKRKFLWCMIFLLFRDSAECFFPFVSLRVRQSNEETCVDESGNVCGDSWKVVNGVLIFIYTPVISLSLASKPSTLRIELSYSLSLSSLPPTIAHFGAVFALILFNPDNLDNDNRAPL